jgi:hypothetical protein
MPNAHGFAVSLALALRVANRSMPADPAARPDAQAASLTLGHGRSRSGTAPC